LALLTLLTLLTACGGAGETTPAAATSHQATAQSSSSASKTSAAQPPASLAALLLDTPTTPPFNVGGDSAEQLRSAELELLAAAVDTSLLPVARLELPAVANVAVWRDSAGPFLGLRTYAGQPLVNGGVRAELTVDHPFVPGDRVRYSWSFAIAPDFPADPQMRWWLIGNLHDQPDASRGETWSTYQAHSPSVGLGFGRRDGQDYIALLYGTPTPSSYGLVPIRRGVWHTVTLEVNWSQRSDGKVALYVDSAAVPALTATGANMYNAYQHYLKVGSYRDPAITGDAWIYVRDVKVQTLSR